VSYDLTQEAAMVRSLPVWVVGISVEW